MTMEHMPQALVLSSRLLWQDVSILNTGAVRQNPDTANTPVAAH